MPAETQFASQAVTQAKETSQQLLTAAQERSRHVADSAQRYIQQHPVRAVSYSSALVLGIGIVIGRLLAPSAYRPHEAATAAREALREWTHAPARRSEDWLGVARDTSKTLLDNAQQQSQQLLDSAEVYVHEHPIRSASYAALALLGLAAVVGLMAASGSEERTAE